MVFCVWEFDIFPIMLVDFLPSSPFEVPSVVFTAGRVSQMCVCSVRLWILELASLLSETFCSGLGFFVNNTICTQLSSVARPSFNILLKLN